MPAVCGLAGAQTHFGGLSLRYSHSNSLTSFGSNSNDRAHPRHSALWNRLRRSGVSAAARRTWSSGPNRNADVLEERGGYPLESTASSPPVPDLPTRLRPQNFLRESERQIASGN